MWRSDFRLRRVPPANGSIGLEMDTALQGDQISGKVQLSTEAVPVRNLRLTVVLPEGTTYTPGSSRLVDRSLPDPAITDGNLVYRLGEMEAEEVADLQFEAQVNPPLRRAQLEVKTLLVCDTPTQRNARTKVVRTTMNLLPETIREEQPEIILHPHFASLSADLSHQDMAQIDTLLADLNNLDKLDIVAVKVIGHTDGQRIRPGAHSKYPDNHALSQARADAVGKYLSRTLKLHESRLTMYGRGASEPMADNRTAEGRALNRRVILQIWTEKVVHLLPEDVVRDHERVKLAVVGFRPGENWPAIETAISKPNVMPDYDQTWLATSGPGEHILWPPAGHLPHLPALKLAVQHAAADSVHILINGRRTGLMNFVGQTVSADGTRSVSTWNGLDLDLGDNILTVKITDSRSRLVRHLERTVHYSSPPVFAELVPERSVLVADGKTIPVLALRLTDNMGYPARREVVGKFTVAAPHEAWRDKGESQRETIVELQKKTPNYTVGPDGIALLRLAPTTTSGEALINLGLQDHTEEIRVWLEPQSRDWILAGVAEGTMGYNTVVGNLENLKANDSPEGFYTEGRLAFFAKGRLKGKWLLTMAYDSQNPDPGPGSGLFGVVDPDAYYTVYGDAVIQKHDAPTRDHLYIRLEREQFYALYGDFNAGLTMTELTPYNRAMTGFNSSGRINDFGFDVFASKNSQGFRRDEIRGDGTSGLYQLSAGRIIPQSDKITLQVRDQYRNELILSERPLVRSVDYTLDDLDGTLFFKEVIPSQDENFNPVWIVAEYETDDATEAEITTGGRGSWRPDGQALEVGVSAIREGGQGGRGDILAGLDTRWDLTRSIRLKGEYGGSSTRETGYSEAWFGEISNRVGPVLGRIYYRDQDAGFGLGHQNAGESGTRKLGANISWQQHENWHADGIFFSRHNLISGAERHFGELKLNHNGRRFTAGVGLRAANDETADGQMLQSRQVTADASVKVLQNKGRIRISREQSVSGQDNITDFPTRSGVAMEYEVVRNQKLFLTRELVDGGSSSGDRTRAGVESVPWTGAQITSSAESRNRENDHRVFANLGLKQSLRLNDSWHLDTSLDHGQSTEAAPDSLASSTANPDNDFTAGSLGMTYQAGLWLVNQRLEYRTSENSEKWGCMGGVHVEPGRNLGLLASVRLIRTHYRNAGHHHLSDLGLGLAWRPEDNPWTILQRLSYRTEDKTGDPFAISNWRIVNNLNVLRMLGTRDQVSTQLGLRYNRDTIDGRQYDGFTDQMGLEWRHFIGSRWDVGLRTATRHHWQSGSMDYSAGVSGGFKVLEDLWLSLGYNFTGYHDRDFSAADYTAQGPYLRFRVRLNQEMTNEMLR
ncbi:MAG: OmpA family protein [Gammaproteobacteria bacterium]|nr:OmpA family protein [Gammaproteobacteria bacterium]